jgi:acetyl esterase
MFLDPQVRRLLDSVAQAGLPPISTLSLAAARQQMINSTALLGQPDAVDSIEDRTIPSSAGEIPIRIYKPAGEQLPIVVYFYGGAFLRVDRRRELVCVFLVHQNGSQVLEQKNKLLQQIDEMFPVPKSLSDGTSQLKRRGK